MKLRPMFLCLAIHVIALLSSIENAAGQSTPPAPKITARTAVEGMPQELLKKLRNDYSDTDLEQATKHARTKINDKPGTFEFVIRTVSPTGNQYTIMSEGADGRVEGIPFDVMFLVYIDSNQHSRLGSKLQSGKKLKVTGKVSVEIVRLKSSPTSMKGAPRIKFEMRNPVFD